MESKLKYLLTYLAFPKSKLSSFSLFYLITFYFVLTIAVTKSETIPLKSDYGRHMLLPGWNGDLLESHKDHYVRRNEGKCQTVLNFFLLAYYQHYLYSFFFKLNALLKTVPSLLKKDGLGCSSCKLWYGLLLILS